MESAERVSDEPLKLNSILMDILIQHKGSERFVSVDFYHPLSVQVQALMLSCPHVYQSCARKHGTGSGSFHVSYRTLGILR